MFNLHNLALFICGNKLKKILLVIIATNKWKAETETVETEETYVVILFPQILYQNLIHFYHWY